MAMMLCMAAMAQRVPLRIISQAPVEGVEEARSLIFDRYGLMWVGTDQGVAPTMAIVSEPIAAMPIRPASYLITMSMK